MYCHGKWFSDLSCERAVCIVMGKGLVICHGKRFNDLSWKMFSDLSLEKV